MTHKASALMINPLESKHLAKIVSLKCDIATINLEDGVAQSKKADALSNCVTFLQENPNLRSKICIRVNELPNCIEEIKALNKLKPNAIRIPKIYGREELLKVLDVLEDSIELHFSVETSKALNSLSKLKIDKRVTTCYLGLLDMSNDIGLSHQFLSPSNAMVGYIESKFLFEARSAGFKAFAPIYQDYKNLDALKTWCEFELSLGFDAKGAVSPSQLEIINQIFGLNDLTKAKYIIKKFEEMDAKGISGFSDEYYGFIDEPIYKNALLQLRL